jgi:hypothetical protein
MPARQKLSLTVSEPLANGAIKLNQPFPVNGIVLDQGPPEPHAIDSVTVQVDGGPVIRATLQHIPDKTATRVSFHTAAQATGGQDPHIVTVTATDDQGASVRQTRQLFTGAPFQVDAPAVVIDVLSIFSFDEFTVLGQTAPIQEALQGASDSLAGIGKIIAGPNFQFFNSNDPTRPSRLRMGVWIEDASFPVVRHDGLTLPVLSDLAAAEGFNSAPPVPVPETTHSFGISIPVATIRKLLNAVAQDIKDEASAKGVTLDTIAVNTVSPESVTTTFEGSMTFGVPFHLTVTEVLGLQGAPAVPAVLSSDHSSGLGNILDLIIAAVLKPFRAVLAIEFLALRSKAGDADREITGIMQPLVAAMPPRFPFRNTLLPFGLATPPDFPAIVLDWKAFRANSGGILGMGLLTIEARIQSEVELSIDGQRFISGFQGELAGNVRSDYSFQMVNLAPDRDKFTWHVSGAAGTRSGAIDSVLGLGGKFTADFPLPLHAGPGKYPFTLTVSAAETCGTDPTKTLTASAQLAVVLDVKAVHNPQLKAERVQGGGA